LFTNKKRVEYHIELLSTFTATPNQGVTRLTYSAEDLKAREYIKEKMIEYGLSVREDGLGNIFGKMEGIKNDKPSILIGSHFDSVPNGGAYDGTLGVVAGLEIAAIFHENNIKPIYPIEIIALVEEEGSRFGGALMGSRGMTGLIEEEDYQHIKDENSISVIEAMEKIGLDFTKNKYRDPSTIKAFLELHIEQGPILEEKEITIGIVDAIVGLTQLEVTVEGRAGHAGTTPMNLRDDALVVASEIISILPEIAIEQGEETVITTGRLQVYPNGANVIPEKVIFTIDLRSSNEEDIQQAHNKVKKLIESKNKKQIRTSIKQHLYMPPKALNEAINKTFKKNCDKLDISYHSMNSGAGHDAMVFSDVTDVGMIFVPSKDGLSHCPEEWSDAEHISQGIEVLFETVKELAEV